MNDDCTKKRKINIGEIITNIKIGKPVEYEDVIIEGDLVISNLDLPKETPGLLKISSKIKIINSEIKGIIDLNNAMFENQIIFENVKFNKNVNFGGCKFCHESCFRKSKFTLVSYFEKTRFQEATDFSGSEFNNGVRFNLCVFEGPVDFSNSKFIMGVDFEGAHFGEYVHFTSADFQGYTDFRVSEFKRIAFFNGAQFSGELVFNKVQFTTLVLAWSSIKKHLEYDGYFYLALIKNYKDLSWFDDADDCYYQYRKLSFLEKKLGLMKIIDGLACISYGYGKKPKFPLVLSLIFIMIFGIYFSSGDFIAKYTYEERFEPSSVSIGELENKKIFLENQLSPLDPFLFSLGTFTSGLASLLYPFTVYKLVGYNAQIAATFETILGSVLITLLLGTIVNRIVR